jgi:hypothetical protein
MRKSFKAEGLLVFLADALVTLATGSATGYPSALTASG